MKVIIKQIMQAVLFCRVSTKEQEETGFSLPSQQKLLSEYSTRKGFTSAKVFLVSESASGKKQRKTFIEMMQFIKKEKIKIIICEKTDRLTRNLKDTQIMYDWLEEDAERQIHLVKDSLILHKNSRSQEKLNLDIRVVFAKNYIDNLSEEVKKGQKEKIAQGWLPTKPPLGYKTIGEEGRKVHILDNRIAPLVKEMFEFYASGEYSLERLTKLMYEKGLRYPKGTDICRGRIHQLLFNPFYYGKISWNNDLYEGKQEPLISQELFEQVQQILRRKNTPKYSKHFYTLRKLTTCKECKGLITWETQKGHVYGHCNRYKGCSQSAYVKESKIEKKLSQALLKLQIKNPRINAWLIKVLEYGKTEVVQNTTASLKNIQAKLDLIDNKMENLYDDKEEGIITKEFYKKKSEKYTNEKKETEKLLTNNDQSQLENREVGINVYKLSQKAHILFEKAKPEFKRELIRLVFDDLLIENGELEYTYSEGFTILFALVNAFNSSNFANIEELVNREFEQKEKLVIARQIDSFTSSYPVLLGKLDLKIIPEKRKGRGAARYAGFHVAKGNIIFSTDADTVVPPDWIEQILSYFNNKRIVAITGTCKITDTGKSKNTFLNIGQPLCMRLYRIIFGHYWLSGFNFAITKEAYEKAGGFRVDLNVQEDTDLAFRVSKVGNIKFIDNLPVVVSGRRFQKGVFSGLIPYLTTFVGYFFFKKTNTVLSDIR